jgi:hypothetical protein
MSKAEALHIVCKAGPLRNGAERGHGSIWHLTEHEPHFGGEALCGARPAIMWSKAWRPDQQVTCKKCKKLGGEGPY